MHINIYIKPVVIETTGVCDVTSVMWRYIFHSDTFIGLFFQNALVDHIGVYTDTNKGFVPHVHTQHSEA